MGFGGTEGDDSENMYTTLLTIFLITNVFFWKVLVGFLSDHSSSFKEHRENPLRSFSSIIIASLFDVVVTLLPILAIWAYYE